MIYKLVGSSRLVQWTRVVNTRSLFIPWRTELPDDEYNRQTRELCVSITRLTGLQLRDLSEEEQGPDARRQEMLIQSQLHR